MPSKGSGIVLKIFFLSLTLIFFSCFQVRSVLSDPKNGFNADEALTEDDVHKIKEVSNFLWVGNDLNSTYCIYIAINKLYV